MCCVGYWCVVCAAALCRAARNAVSVTIPASTAANDDRRICRCDTRSLRSDLVEPLIWQALADLLREPQRIHDAWAAVMQPTAVVSERDARRQHLLQQQRQRLLDAYQAGLLQLDELTQRQNPLELELQELQKRLAHNPAPAPVQISLAAFTERIQHALAASDDETKQEVLRLLIERIVVSDEALTVEHIIPTVDVSRLHPTHHASLVTFHSRQPLLQQRADPRDRLRADERDRRRLDDVASPASRQKAPGRDAQQSGNHPNHVEQRIRD